MRTTSFRYSTLNNYAPGVAGNPAVIAGQNWPFPGIQVGTKTVKSSVFGSRDLSGRTNPGKKNKFSESW
jgi:hypothetical protein